MADNGTDTMPGSNDGDVSVSPPIETPMSPDPNNAANSNDSNRSTAKINSIMLSPGPQLMMEPQMSPSPTKPSSFGSAKRMTSKLDASTILLSPGNGSSGPSMEEPSPVKTSSVWKMNTEGALSPKPATTEQRAQSLMMLSPTVGRSPTLMEPSPLQGTRGTVIDRPQSMVLMSPKFAAGGAGGGGGSGGNQEPSPFQPVRTSSAREGLMGAVEPPSVVAPSVNEKRGMRISRRITAPANSNDAINDTNAVRPGAIRVDGVTPPSIVEPGGGKSGMRISRGRLSQTNDDANVVRPGAVRVDGPGDGGHGEGGDNVVSSQHQVVTSTSRTRANPLSSSSSSKKQHLVGGPAVVPGAVSMTGSVVNQYDNAISNLIKSNDDDNHNNQFQGTTTDDNDNNNQFQHVMAGSGRQSTSASTGGSLTKQRISISSCPPGAVPMPGVVDRSGSTAGKGGRLSRRSQFVSTPGASYVSGSDGNIVEGQSFRLGAVSVSGMGDGNDDQRTAAENLKGGRISRRSQAPRISTIGAVTAIEEGDTAQVLSGISEDKEMSEGTDTSLLNAKSGIGRRHTCAVSEKKGIESAKMASGNNYRRSTGMTGQSTTDAASANTANSSAPPRTSARVSVVDGSGAFRIDATNRAMEAIGGVDGSKEDADPNKNRPIWIAGGVSFVVVILIAAIVGAVVAINGGDNKETVEVQPTGAPTSNTARLEVLEKFVNILQPYSTGLNDPLSPQYEAAQWLSKENENIAEDQLENLSVTDELLQRYVLAAFYYSLGGRGNDLLASWLENEVPECEWLGVECSEDGVVEKLVLENKSLSGTLVSELGHLTQLTGLNLVENDVQGSLPPEMFTLSLLRDISLSDNKITGTLPSELRLLPELQKLRLDSNEISGGLRTEITELANLTQLGLTFNLISGNVPSEIGRMSSLQHILLGENGLFGELPSEIGRLTNLQSLHLYSNQLRGAIPTELGDLSALNVVRLSQNQFSGTIITEFGRLPNVKVLIIGTNFIEGTIPITVGNMTKLNQLDLSQLRLSGPIPSEVGLLPDLVYFNANSNFLSGEVPTELSGLTKLGTLWLHQNELVGDLDPVVCDLRDFHVLTDSRSDCLEDDDVGVEILCTCCTKCCNDIVGCEN